MPDIKDLVEDLTDDQLQRVYMSLFTQNCDDSEPSGCDSELANSLREEIERRESQPKEHNTQEQ